MSSSNLLDDDDDIDLDDVDADLLSVMDELDSKTPASPHPKSGPTEAHLDCLRQQFGHSSFRPFQWSIIQSILEDRRDNCVVMATGYGKSLCFQFPSVFLQGITIVVSPLISLMQDQVLALKVANIPACLLGSAQTDRTILDQVLAGDFRLVYVSPEYITSYPELLDKLADQLTLVAIDEAHCVSQWGHDFRQCYRSLGRIRMRIPAVPILAVTATATDRVRLDICQSLGLRNPQSLSTGFDRANLEFIVRKKTTVWEDLRTFVHGANVPRGSIIVYCLTRKVTEAVAEVLNRQGVVCAAYHAGLSVKRRNDIHEQFVKDKLQVIVATIAFGMGIDKPDVRLVIHYGASRDIESYYQEVGRAGRDGQPSRCVMFQSDQDFNTHATLRSLSKVSASVSVNLERLSGQMKQFVRGDMCRRLFILRYFEGPSADCLPRYDCCDNCRRPKTSPENYEGMNDLGQLDYTVDATRLLQVVELFNGYTGLAKPISVLRGSQNKSVAKYIQHTLHGVGKFKSESYWKQMAEMLEAEDMLVKSRKSIDHRIAFQVVGLTDKGLKFLRGGRSLWLKPTTQMLQFTSKKYVGPANSTHQVNAECNELLHQHEKETRTERLANSLMACRFALATRFDAMPYMIATNLALQQIAQAQPLNLADLKAANIDGMSDAKIQQFGPSFVECVIREKNYLPTEVEVHPSGDQTMVSLLQCNPMVGVNLTENHLRFLPLVREETTLEQMCSGAAIKESTLSTYLTILIRSGYPIRRVHIECMTKMSPQTFDTISATLPKDSDALLGTSLRHLKQALPEFITYDQIHMTLAYRQVRQHLHNIGRPFIDPDVDPIPETEETTVEAVDDDVEEEPFDVHEMLEDLCLPTSQPPSVLPTTSEPPLDIDWGSDFEEEQALAVCSVATADLTPEELFLSGNDEEDDMLGRIVEASVELCKATTTCIPHSSSPSTSKPKTLPNKRVMYVDSDSEEDEVTASTSTTRRLPDWMLQPLPPMAAKITKVPHPAGGRKKGSIF